ncbi:protocatechuatedioxygenase beta subunit protein [Venturia nashicola]|nr:protocatechuatedioxygenase beta subunit protein [Venturia nashicola]
MGVQIKEVEPTGSDRKLIQRPSRFGRLGMDHQFPSFFPSRSQSHRVASPIKEPVPSRSQSHQGASPIKEPVLSRSQSHQGASPIKEPVPSRSQSHQGASPIKEPVPSRSQSHQGASPIKESVEQELGPQSCYHLGRCCNCQRNALRKRELETRSNVTYQITTEAPFYEVIQNDTCILTPEVTQGPYVWPRSQTLRQDMTEGQAGVPFDPNIGVIDINTCEPLPNALVDLWHCNATGSYSSFTDSDGVMEMKTIVPGFYVDRAIPIHVQVHIDWSVTSNGTITSSNRVSTGQLYLNETVSQQLMALEPYVSHIQINRTTNDIDSTYGQSAKGTGYGPVMDIVAADGVNIANGVIGYIRIGVDTTDVQTGSLGGAPS